MCFSEFEADIRIQIPMKRFDSSVYHTCATPTTVLGHTAYAYTCVSSDALINDTVCNTALGHVNNNAASSDGNCVSVSAFAGHTETRNCAIQALQAYGSGRQR